jgi:periplasmic divalent cation tolerance protein
MAPRMWLVYVTASSRPEAERIARSAVKARLAACANLLGPVCSIYKWRGRVETSGEVVLLLKTSASRRSQLISHVKRLHSYETPCIISIRVAGGWLPFLQWVEQETLPARRPKTKQGPKQTR